MSREKKHPTEIRIPDLSVEASAIPPPSRPTLGSQEISDAIAKALTALYPKIQALNEYSTYLEDSDKNVNGFIEGVITQTQSTYRTTIRLYTLTYSVALASIVAGLVLFFFENTLLAITCILTGLIVLLFLVNRSPIKNIRYLVNNLVKLNVLYMGYTRQIHQVDATFKNLLSNTNGIDPAKMEEMLGHIQAAVDETMNAISLILDEMQD